MTSLGPWLPLLAAPFIGSLLGVLIRRLPSGRGVFFARSACESCGCRLTPPDLVPIASYLALRGRCRGCHARIAPFHLIIECVAVLVPLVALGAGLRDPTTLWVASGLGWTLLALAWIDAWHFLLPDALTLPLVLAGIAWCGWSAPGALADHAAAAVLGWAAFRAVALLYRRLRGQEGLGEGDAKLLAAGGAWLGLGALGPTVLIAAGVGLVGALAMRAGRTTRVPFGPALAGGIFVMFLWGAR